MKQKTNVQYDRNTDAMWIQTHKGAETDSKELAPGITVEYGKNGSVIGFEILRASEVLSPFLNQQRGIISNRQYA